MAKTRLAWGDEVGIATLAEGFNRGFNDYKYGTTFDSPGMSNFLKRSGIRRANCIVLLVHEDGEWHGAGCALLAMEDGEGWCGGLAMAAEYRRQGHAQRLMQALHRRAAQQSVRRIQLEVLVENQPAIQLYADIGYTKGRRLLIWENTNDSEPARAAATPLTELDAVEAVEALGIVADWQTTPPVWQRSVHFLHNQTDGLNALSIAQPDGEMTAIALYQQARRTEDERPAIRLADVGVKPDAVAAGAGDKLLGALLSRFSAAGLTLINEPDGSALEPSLRTTGFQVVDQQVEMQLDLAGWRGSTEDAAKESRADDEVV